MTVLVTQTYRFVREGWEDVTVFPSRTPQNVPDDFRDHPLFQLAKMDGSIVEVELSNPVPDNPVPTPRSKSNK